ncbi:hypothetical protein Bhyg_10423 [Pseudolycoriella hygida]|uniref:Uncharacterized protein n=1 Tax=Pseudolycoriella hygida TaxID=35572 RepID=A0A9Q0MW62_9DIPT|nr:hypothetical protein Bhyg_10423 [Pseudolycoriella hygida]
MSPINNVITKHRFNCYSLQQTFNVFKFTVVRRDQFRIRLMLLPLFNVCGGNNYQWSNNARMCLLLLIHTSTCGKCLKYKLLYECTSNNNTIGNLFTNPLDLTNEGVI